MNRNQHDLIRSLHCATIAKALMASDYTLTDEADINAQWLALWPRNREHYHQQARIAIRSTDEAARAVASYEAREVFCQMFKGWQPNPFQYSQVQKAFEAALTHYTEHLANGPFPVGQPTAEEDAAYDAGVADSEAVTGHGRY